MSDLEIYDTLTALCSIDGADAAFDPYLVSTETMPPSFITRNSEWDFDSESMVPSLV